MQEITKRVECYIRGEESNVEKSSRDAKDQGLDLKDDKRPDRGPRRGRGRYGRPYEPPHYDRAEGRGRPLDSYTLLNSKKVHVLHHIIQARLAELPRKNANKVRLGPDKEAWCQYHRAKGHETEDCYHLRDIIEELVKAGHLDKYMERRSTKEESSSKKILSWSPKKNSHEKGKAKKSAHHVINTISGGFSGGGESNTDRKRYLRQVNHVTELMGEVSFPKIPELSFSEKDSEGVVPHDNDPLVIQVHILGWDLKRVLMDTGNSANIMYWDAFAGMKLTTEQLHPYSGTLVGFSGEQVEVCRYVMLLTTFGEGQNEKAVKVKYLVIKTPLSSYSIIIGRPTFNALGAIMSMQYLMVKYPLDNGRVEILRGDQATARKCYQASLKAGTERKASSRPDLTRNKRP
jgi:hypothetical protein